MSGALPDNGVAARAIGVEEQAARSCLRRRHFSSLEQRAAKRTGGVVRAVAGASRCLCQTGGGVESHGAAGGVAYARAGTKRGPLAEICHAHGGGVARVGGRDWFERDAVLSQSARTILCDGLRGIVRGAACGRNADRTQHRHIHSRACHRQQQDDLA